MSEYAATAQTHDTLFENCKPIDEGQIQRDVAFGEFDTMVRNQAAMRSHYGVQHARYYHAMKKAKSNLDFVEARLDMAIRTQAEQEGEKVTEGKIGSRIKSHDMYRAAKELLEEAEMHAKTLEHVIAALDSKRDMLIQHSKHLLIEQGGDMRIHGDRGAEAAALNSLREAGTAAAA